MLSRRHRCLAVCGFMLLATAGSLAQTPAPPRAPRSPYQEAGTLPARIMEFRAEPAAIRPGEAVTLIWATENPRTISIDPQVGRASPRGRMTLRPERTTTFTLTVTGVNGTQTRTATVTVAGTTPAAPGAGAATSGPAPAPRTLDGKPDLSGVWGYGVGPGRGAPPPPPGSLPRTPTLKPGAESYRVQRGPTDTGLYSTCEPPGVPQTFFVPYYVQLVQSPATVVILHEYLHLFRVIPTDGSPHPADPDPSWMGHSTGRWEGDTLVVDSVGFNDKTEITGYRHSEALHVVERFRRPTRDTLEYEAVIEDPNVFAGPWVITRTFPLLPEYNRVDEFFCENNRDYKGLFGK